MKQICDELQLTINYNQIVYFIVLINKWSATNKQTNLNEKKQKNDSCNAHDYKSKK